MPQPDQLSLDKFADLVREHQAALRAFVCALGVETDWVDDIAQEVFVVAYRRREHFDNKKDFGKWLRGIARHLVLNERRKEARHARILCGPVTDMLLENQRVSEAEEPADTCRLVQAMNDCIAQLPERSRNLLRKRYEAENNASTLSSLFRMRSDAIRQSLMRIRAWVKQCVENKQAWP
jgi:RNA polymerase sigma-70 factor (ECF subfamily)